MLRQRDTYIHIPIYSFHKSIICEIGVEYETAQNQNIKNWVALGYCVASSGNLSTFRDVSVEFKMGHNWS